MHRLQFHYTLSRDSSPALVRNPLIDLLQAVSTQGSISAGARALGLSYRHVWGELKRWEQELGHELVVWEKGQSARLTEFGAKLMWAESQAQARLAPQIEALRANYAAAGVQADLTPFIDDTAQAFADADLVIGRAGASTVTELAAVGAAAVFVPFPAAVDDHQTVNARFLVEAGGGWLLPQAGLTPDALAELLQGMDRSSLLARAQAAASLKQINATASVVAACEELAS